MFRYISIVWNCAEQPASTLASRLVERISKLPGSWTCSVKRDGVVVYNTLGNDSGCSANVLPNKSGAVLGTIFRTCTSNNDLFSLVSAGFDINIANKIVRTGGRELITSFWGNYVAVIFDEETQIIRIICGPSSSLPCFAVEQHGVRVFFSLMDDCQKLGIGPFSLNWEYLSLCTLTTVLSEQTGLNEISRIRPGECLEIDVEGAKTFVYWNPFNIARRVYQRDVNESAIALRRTTRACVQAWASCYESIVHFLSGGLDSSIVLACLGDPVQRSKMTCLTYYADGADSDERPYARLAAKHIRCTYIEREREPHVDLRAILNADRSPIPQEYFRRAELSQTTLQLAQQAKAHAIFSGSGGDQLFFQSEASLCAADFIRQRGVTKELFGVAYHAAQLEGFSIWRVLVNALRKASSANRCHPLTEVVKYRRLLGNRALEIIRASMRARSTTDAPPGKAWHIFGLSTVDDFYNPLGTPEYPQNVAPLFSQPLIELCLRIPTYILTHDGWDRCLARKAFAEDLPSDIIHRRSKGGLDQHMLEMLRFNLSFARELLLDGVLVQQHLIDRTKLEEALLLRPSDVTEGMGEIFSLLDMEAWARNWTYEAQCVSA